MIAKIYVTIVAIGLIFMTLTACWSDADYAIRRQNDSSNKEIAINAELQNKDMRDCVVHVIDTKTSPTLYAIRCPNSETSTTFQTGKATHTTTIVVDGIEYVEKK